MVFSIYPQSIQSARLSLLSSELAPPAPSLASECCPPPFGSGGDTLVCGRGGAGANSDEGTEATDFLVLYNILWYIV
jgi:hypothetical protein